MEMCINSNLVHSKTKKSIRSITTSAMLLAVLVAQEFILASIPQVSLTVILIIIYARYLSYKELIPVVIAYVFLDNLLMGSLNFIYTMPMLISWPLLAIIARAIRNKPIYLSFIWSILFAFIYGWMFIPANMIMMSNFNVWLYLKLDWPFEFMMAINSLTTFLIFYQPIISLFDTYYKKTNEFIY